MEKYLAFLSSNYWKTYLDEYIYKTLSSFFFIILTILILSLQTEATNSISFFGQTFHFLEWKLKMWGMTEFLLLLVFWTQDTLRSAIWDMIKSQPVHSSHWKETIDKAESLRLPIMAVMARMSLYGPRMLHVLSHLIVITELQGRYYYHVQIKKA